MTGTEDLVALGRLLVAFPGADVIEGATLGTAAVSLAAAGLAVAQLAPRSKAPLHTCPITRAHRAARRQDRCPGGCGNEGHGVLDATVDLPTTARRWAATPTANILGAVPAAVVVLDVDPRNGGDVSLRRLVDEHGPLPATLQARSGGKDGGRHIWFRHPGGTLRTAGRPELAGIDLRLRGNYLVVEPSVHPDGGTYRWVDTSTPIAPLPGWLIDKLRPPVVAHPPRAAWPVSGMADSPADWYCASHTWWDVLGPHGWRPLDPEGARWRHPNATSSLSATVTNDCLFVYSTNTPFEPTGAGDPHGITKFKAWATLDHGGDRSAAARAALQLRQGQQAA